MTQEPNSPGYELGFFNVELNDSNGCQNVSVMERYAHQSPHAKLATGLKAVFDSWEGPEAYVENLTRYCEVVFIPEEVAGVSSTALRGVVSIGVIGAKSAVERFIAGAAVTSGIDVVATQIESQNLTDIVPGQEKDTRACKTLEQLYESTDAVYLFSNSCQRKKTNRTDQQAQRTAKISLLPRRPSSCKHVFS